MKYLEWIKQQPCSVCGDTGFSDAHHLKGHKLGKNMKCDLLVIPLCRTHHNEYHKNPTYFVEVYGSQESFLCKTLIRAEFQGWALKEEC